MSPQQVCLAWMLAQSPVVIPIPGSEPAGERPRLGRRGRPATDRRAGSHPGRRGPRAVTRAPGSLTTALSRRTATAPGRSADRPGAVVRPPTPHPGGQTCWRESSSRGTRSDIRRSSGSIGPVQLQRPVDQVPDVGVRGEEAGQVLTQGRLDEHVPGLVGRAGGRGRRWPARCSRSTSWSTSSSTSSGVTTRPSASLVLWCSHCQIWVREISTVAASSIRLSMATAPCSLTHAVRYCSATEMLVRSPARVTVPGVRAGGDQVGGGDVHVRALLVELVRPVAEHRGERRRCRSAPGRDGPPRSRRSRRRPPAPCPP